jgi:hypothetical protein
MVGHCEIEKWSVIARSENGRSLRDWKMVGHCAIGKWSAIARLENRGQCPPYACYVRSIEEMEELTGYDFFSNLTDSVESTLEKQTRSALVSRIRQALNSPPIIPPITSPLMAESYDSSEFLGTAIAVIDPVRHDLSLESLASRELIVLN